MTLTGRHVVALFVGGFAVTCAANLALAVSALRSFPGLETANAYVASQSFDARRAAQRALHWQVGTAYAGGVLHLSVTAADGTPIDPAGFAARIGRPASRAGDRVLTFDAQGDAPVPLTPGRWRLDLHRTGDGPAFARTIIFEVPG